jgi:hypothetical protein
MSPEQAAIPISTTALTRKKLKVLTPIKHQWTRPPRERRIARLVTDDYAWRRAIHLPCHDYRLIDSNGRWL